VSILTTKVVYRDTDASDVLEKDIKGNDEIHIDLSDVGAVTPGDDEDECIIFIQGRDLLIKHPYYETLALWKKSKEGVSNE
jgi:hypothetical protein